MNFINNEIIFSPKYEIIYSNFNLFNPFSFSSPNVFEDENKSSYNESPNFYYFHPIIPKENESEKWNIEKSYGIETQIIENQKPKKDLLEKVKADLSIINTKCSTKMLSNNIKRTDEKKKKKKKKK